MNYGAMEAISEKGNILIKFDREYSEVLVLDKNLYLLLDSNKEGKYVNRKGEFIKDYKAIL